MTTDITELAQRLKAAAENAIWAHERLAAYPYGEIIDISQHEGEQIDIDITDLNEFNKEANPVNILALVEALEKAQGAATQQGNIACALLDEVTQLRRHADEKAPELRALLIEADSELEVLRQRIAELESRTVKMPKLKMLEDYLAEVAVEERKAILLGVRMEFHRAINAAGIKVGAE